MKNPIRFLVLLLALAFLPGLARVSAAAKLTRAEVEQAISDTEKELQGWRDRIDDLKAAAEGDAFAKRKLSYGKPGEEPTIAVLFNSGGNLRIGDESAEHAMGQGYSGDAVAQCEMNIARLEADLETQRKALAKIEEEERKELEEAWKKQREIEQRLDREEEWAWDWNRDRDLASKGKPGYTMEAVDRHYRTGAGSRDHYINGTQQPFSPKTTLHTEPTAATPPENGGGSAPSGGGALDKFLDQQTQASNNRGNDSQTLNQYTTQEKEQESKNTIARQDAENTVNQGGQNSQTIGEQSASSTAASQSLNSWDNTLSGALQQSITEGLTSMGTAFAENTAENLVNKLFPPEKQPEAAPGGGAPGVGGAPGGGGQPGGQPGAQKGGGGGGGGKTGGGGGGKKGGGKGGGDNPDGGDGDEGEGGGEAESGEESGQPLEKCDLCGRMVTKRYLCGRTVISTASQVDGSFSRDSYSSSQYACADCLGISAPKKSPKEENADDDGGEEEKEKEKPVQHGRFHKGCGGMLLQDGDDGYGWTYWKCKKCGQRDHWFHTWAVER